MKSFLKNAYDMHTHAGPDVVKRRALDNEIAQSAINLGMRGYVVKSHYFNTAGRAALIRAMFPQCNAVGGVALNNSVGGLNPIAVDMSARAGGKIVWMPTMDAQNMWDFLATSDKPVPFGSFHKEQGKVRGIRVLENGKLAKPIYEILDIVAEHDMVLETGHISKHESLAVVKEAKRRGVRKMLVTHVEFPATYTTLEEQKEYIRCGAKVEFVYLTIVDKDFTIPQLVEHIRALGAENVVLSSDLGQNVNPLPTEGFADYIRMVMEHGATEKEVERMIVTNPAELLE